MGGRITASAVEFAGDRARSCFLGLFGTAVSRGRVQIFQNNNGKNRASFSSTDGTTAYKTPIL